MKEAVVVIIGLMLITFQGCMGIHYSSEIQELRTKVSNLEHGECQ
jgi:hypothetical protein